MKKAMILLLIVVMSVGLCACGKSENTSTNSKEVGSYGLYETKDKEKYLMFLNDLDDNKYELVGVSS